jgi:hypothetical protein
LSKNSESTATSSSVSRSSLTSGKGGVAIHHLDGVSGFGGKAADRCGHVTSADDADSAHVQSPRALGGARTDVDFSRVAKTI